jgi:hypothetical protein
LVDVYHPLIRSPVWPTPLCGLISSHMRARGGAPVPQSRGTFALRTHLMVQSNARCPPIQASRCNVPCCGGWWYRAMLKCPPIQKQAIQFTQAIQASRWGEMATVDVEGVVPGVVPPCHGVRHAFAFAFALLTHLMVQSYARCPTHSSACGSGMSSSRSLIAIWRRELLPSLLLP